MAGKGNTKSVYKTVDIAKLCYKLAKGLDKDDVIFKTLLGMMPDMTDLQLSIAFPALMDSVIDPLKRKGVDLSKIRFREIPNTQ